MTKENFLLPKNCEITYVEYAAICKYLNYNPDHKIFINLKLYLKNNFQKIKVVDFKVYLNLLKKDNFINICFLDIVSKYFLKNFFFRKQINCIIALHECDYGSSLIDYNIPKGFYKTVIRLFFKLTFFIFLFIFSLPLFLIHYFIYKIKPKFNLKFFNNKKILIVGGGSELGCELIKLLLMVDSEIVILVNNSILDFNHLKNVKVIKINLNEEKNVYEKLQDDISNVDIVYFFSAIKKNTLNINYHNTKEHFNINFFSVVKLLEVVKNKNCHFFITSSIGRYHGMINTFNYNASKAALSIYLEGIILSFPDLKITIIEPGSIFNINNKKKKIIGLLSISFEKAANKILVNSHKNKLKIVFPIYFKLLTTFMLFFSINFFKKIIKFIR